MSIDITNPLVGSAEEQLLEEIRQVGCISNTMRQFVNTILPSKPTKIFATKFSPHRTVGNIVT